MSSSQKCSFHVHDFTRKPGFITQLKGPHGFTFGKPPWKAKTIKQKIKEANYKDPAIHYKVNIGLPRPIQCRRKLLAARMAYLRKIRHDAAFEKLVRENKATVDLDEVRYVWLNTVSAYHIKSMAEHYGVFQDLFGDAYFYPFTCMEVVYKINGGFLPVYRGNTIKPMQASEAPDVCIRHEEGSLYTLVLTNPDGHLSSPNSEYVHWAVGNIPDGDVTKGEEIYKYMRPFPPRGVGYQRLIFVLYKQEKKLDYSSITEKSQRIDLSERTFSTYEFYKQRQDDLTPAGLAFFQTDWDKTVTDFFHNILDIQEPFFEYDFGDFYRKPQEHFPIKEPFNLYMDRYRDPKQIAKEYLVKSLKTHHPFKQPDPPLKYPRAAVVDTKDRPTWIVDRESREAIDYGIVNDYKDIVDPE